MEINFNLLSFESEFVEKTQPADLSEELAFSLLLANANDDIEMEGLQFTQDSQDGKFLPLQGNDFPAPELNVNIVNNTSPQFANVLSEKEAPLSELIVMSHEAYPRELGKDLDLIETPELKQYFLVDTKPIEIALSSSRADTKTSLKTEVLHEKLEFPQNNAEKVIDVYTNMLEVKSFSTIEHDAHAVPLYDKNPQEPSDILLTERIKLNDNVLPNSNPNPEPTVEVSASINIDMQSMKRIYHEAKGIEPQTVESLDPSLLSENTYLSNSLNQKNVVDNIVNSDLKPSEIIENRVFGQDLFSKISLMVKSNETSARIQIDPPELGKMEIKITQIDEKANILFISNIEATRNLIETNVDKLAMNLAQNGIDLGNVFVAQEDKQHANPHAQAPYHEVLSPDASLEENASHPVKISTMNLIDLYV